MRKTIIILSVVMSMFSCQTNNNKSLEINQVFEITTKKVLSYIR